MHGGGVHAVELVFLSLLAFVVLFAAVARKLNLPYPIVLLLAGLLLSFLPRVPKVTLNPDVIFLIVLPPLLYSAAWVTSWRDFRFNLFSIFMLAFGLVAFTGIRSGFCGAACLCGLHVATGLPVGRSGVTHRLNRGHVHRPNPGAAAAHLAIWQPDVIYTAEDQLFRAAELASADVWIKSRLQDMPCQRRRSCRPAAHGSVLDAHIPAR